MNWYLWFFKKANEYVNDHYSATRLFIALTETIANSEYFTKQDLQELIRAYKDYEKGVRYNERTTSTVSAG
ncbi:hypothetical protein [Ornithinibacillus bavariensis]|uniref:hypothetical protein n=1 Tax=Ornithinibacillus bavariensis TaxID=545502 RepID=UPI000EE6A2EE|nr:hypothetical protein [Ornithinibacillus sp.]